MIWGRRLVMGLAIAIAATVLPAAAGAQVIYDHNADIWVMNDDGSGAHPIVKAFGFPGPGPWTIGDPDVLPTGNTIVFTGTTQANQAPPGSGPAGNCGINCEGTYKLQNGVLTRLTASPAPCGSPQWCSSFSTSPHLTANGLVAFDYYIGAWDYSCPGGIGTCNWYFTDSSDQLETQSLSGGGATQWAHSAAANDSLSITPLPTPDPADATLMAYAEEVPCTAQGCSFDVHVGTRSGGTDTVVVYDDAPFVSLAWLPDGSALVDVEAGTQAGIWAYDTTPATTATKNFIWLLADPAAGRNGPYSTSINQARYMGSDKILFDQNGDLYWIPLTACAKKATASAAGCTMADAHRLTSSGKDGAAVWTGSQGYIPALGQRFVLTLTSSRSQHVLSQHGLTATTSCSFPCGYAAGGAVKIGRTTYKTRQAGGTLAAGGSTRLTLKLSAKALKAIKTALQKHHAVYALIEVVASTGSQRQTKTFAFKISH